MIVCSCFNVSDRIVRARAQEGRSLEQVLAETGAGRSCGACQRAIARIHAGAQAVPAGCAVMQSARTAA